MPRNSKKRPRKLSWSEFRDPRHLRRWYPNWNRLHTAFNRPQFTANTVAGVLSLSYRQLNEWDSRGYLGFSRQGTTGWRRFRALDLFSLGVLADLKAEGLPIVLFSKERWLAESFAGSLWNAMSYLVEGRQAFLQAGLNGGFSRPFPAVEDSPHPGAIFAGRFSGNGTAVITVGLRSTARRLFSRLSFPDLEIRISSDLKYRFQDPRLGELRLEPLPLTPHTWRVH